MKNMFYEISNLQSVKMFSDKNCKITQIESAFENCKDLEYFYIEGFDTSSIKSLKSLFSLTSLTKVRFRGFSTENVMDMSYMFYDTNLESLNLCL